MPPLEPLLTEYPTLALRDIVPLGNHGGFSGALLFRLRCDQAEYALKLWPADRKEEEIASIHSLMAVARLPFVPPLIAHRRGGTLLPFQGRLAEVSTWQPGIADFWQRPTSERLHAACEAVASLHLAWTPATPRTAPCPGIQRRLHALDAWRNVDQNASSPIPSPSSLGISLEPARALVRRWLAPAQQLLERWLPVDLPVQPCLCDIWHDHVLFTEDAVTGIIDYGSVKEDHVAVDLARMLGSFLGEDPIRRETALDAYHHVRPLTPLERELVPTLDRTGTVAALANWLRWIEEGRNWPNPQAVVQRLNGLVERIEQWVSESRGGIVS